MTARAGNFHVIGVNGTILVCKTCVCVCHCIITQYVLSKPNHGLCVIKVNIIFPVTHGIWPMNGKDCPSRPSSICCCLNMNNYIVTNRVAKPESSPWRLPWSSLETLKTSFNGPSEHQGSLPDDLSFSVVVSKEHLQSRICVGIGTHPVFRHTHQRGTLIKIKYPTDGQEIQSIQNECIRRFLWPWSSTACIQCVICIELYRIDAYTCRSSIGTLHYKLLWCPFITFILIYVLPEADEIDSVPVIPEGQWSLEWAHV